MLPAPQAAIGKCMQDLNFSMQESCGTTSVESKQQAHVYQPDRLLSPTLSG